MLKIILQNFATIGLSVSLLCAFIDFRQGKKKYKLPYFLVTSASLITAFIITSSAAIENKRNLETLENFAIGGDNFPMIGLSPLSDTMEFYIHNPSPDFDLFDVECQFIEVSAKNLIIADMWSPQSAGVFDRLRPTYGQSLHTTLNSDTLSRKFPERRYNFYIVCKNGYFKVQVILRLIGDSLVCLSQVKKDGKIVYVSPNLDKYLFPAETKIIFQHEMEGADKEVTQHVIDSMVKLAHDLPGSKMK